MPLNDMAGYGGYGNFGMDANPMGGFMQDPHPTESLSQSSPSTRIGGGQTQTILAVTIKQLLTAQDNPGETHKIDNILVSQVSIVGQIIAVQSRNINIAFQVDDGTGVIEAKKWSDKESEGESELSSIKEGTYVHIVGNLRAFQNTKSVVVFNIRPIKDFNEITYHLLSAVRLHLLHLKGAIDSKRLPATSHVAVAPSVASVGIGSTGGGYGGYNTFNSLQQSIIDVIKNCGSAKGITAEQTKQMLARTAPNVTIQEVKHQIDFLAAEGHLYSTIDDYHFLCSDS